jgi:intracellular septation protein
MKIESKQEPAGAARLLIDIGPLLIFFLVNFLAPVPGPLKIFVATGAFMAAMVTALVFSAVRYRYVSPLLLFSAVMVVVLGGLTIWFHNENFIKITPTIYYALVAGLLAFGLATGRAVKAVLAYLSRSGRGGLAEADPELGDVLRNHGGGQ